MSPVCAWCGRWVDRANRGFAGYCSTGCRDEAHAERLAWLDDKRRKRLARRLGALGPRTRDT
jgi:hypothetical protein